MEVPLLAAVETAAAEAVPMEAAEVALPATLTMELVLIVPRFTHPVPVLVPS